MYSSYKISHTHTHTHTHIIHLKFQHSNCIPSRNETSDVSIPLKDTQFFSDVSICFDIHTIKTSIEYSGTTAAGNCAPSTTFLKCVS